MSSKRHGKAGRRPMPYVEGLDNEAAQTAL